MRILSNIIWVLTGGWILTILWAFFGALLCVTVIGIPFGLQCFKAAKLSFFPFGKRVILDFAKHPVANLIWVFLGGWEMAIAYFVAGVINCITIIGIGSGIQCFKMMKLAFCPFGAKIKKA